MQSLPKREHAMPETLTPLIVDFLQWLGREPRGYRDAMEAWRTSCPRLTVWEDAFDRGYAARDVREGVPHVVLTALGRAFLADAARARTEGPGGTARLA